MSRVRRLIARVVNVVWPGRADPELEREMAAHLTLMEEDFVRRGLSRDEARLAARRAFGGVEQTKERHRDARSFVWLDDARRDLQYAARALRRSPAFTTVAVLTLALGIGANVAMFSVVYGVLRRPLPYRQPSRLALIRVEADYVGSHRPVSLGAQPGDFDDWRALDPTATTAFFSPQVHVLTTGEGSDVLQSAVVSDNFFSTIGGQFVAGRPLERSDDTEPVVVVSDRLARQLFHDAANAIGHTVTLTYRAYTIIGVADRSFQIPSARVDLWLPRGFARSLSSRCCGFEIVARLRPGVTTAGVQDAMQVVGHALEAHGRAGSGRIHTSVVPLADHVVGPIRPALMLLWASVLIVLGVACSNLINLLLARNTARTRELAIRRAIGASSNRLLRQLLVESAVLAAAGTLGGLLVARVTLLALSSLAGEVLPRVDAVHLDGPVLLFAIGLAAFATFIVGIVPALRAARPEATPGQWGKTSTATGTTRIQRSFCMLQVALAVVLLVGATLLGRSLVRLLDVDLGVTTDHVLTASMTLSFGRRPTDAQALARVGQIVDAVGALPGVRAVGAGAGLPPNGSRLIVTLRRKGDAIDYRATAVPATPGYFAALQMRLIKGRWFTDADDDRHPQVMIMSADTAARLFGPGDPLGQTMAMPTLRDGVKGSADMTLVGIMSNVKYGGLITPPDDVIYRPFAQQPWVAPFLVVKTTGDPAAFATTLRRTIAAVDPAIVTSSIAPLDQLVADAASQPQFRTVLLGVMAALALGIATVGLYGAVAYAVAQRTSEIGIRMALGASSGVVLRMILGEGMSVAATGTVVGVMSAWMLGRALAGLLYGITATDPASFILAAGGLGLLTLIATYIPASRAARVDPLRALRHE